MFTQITQEIALVGKTEPKLKYNIMFAWKRLAHAKQITAIDTVAYILIRTLIESDIDFQNIELDTDLMDEADLTYEAEFFMQKAFTKITNITKLKNGRRPYDTPQRILARMTYDRVLRESTAMSLGIKLTEIGSRNVSLLADIVDI